MNELSTNYGVLRLFLQGFISLVTILIAAMLMWFGGRSIDTNTKMTTLMTELTTMKTQMASLVTQDQLKVETLQIRNEQLQFQNKVLSLMKHEDKP